MMEDGHSSELWLNFEDTKHTEFGVLKLKLLHQVAFTAWKDFYIRLDNLIKGK